MKSLVALAALSAALVLPASFAQAQADYGAAAYHHSYDANAGDYESSPRSGYGSGTIINNSNCPSGTSPHVWPNGSGYRCLPY